MFVCGPSVKHAALTSQGGVSQKETGIPYSKMLFYDDEDRNVRRVRVPCSSVCVSECTAQTSLLHLLAVDNSGTAGCKAGGYFCFGFHARRGFCQHLETRVAGLQ